MVNDTDRKFLPTSVFVNAETKYLFCEFSVTKLLSTILLGVALTMICF